MKKLALGVVAAATVLTVVPALAQVDVRAGDRGVSIGIGEREHWRHRDRDRVIIKRRGVFASDDCRTVTVRRHLPDGSVVVRRTRRCD
jgi:hypothetical protein